MDIQRPVCIPKFTKFTMISTDRYDITILKIQVRSENKHAQTRALLNVSVSYFNDVITSR